MSTHDRRRELIEAAPSYESFRKGFEDGVAQLVHTRLVADLETPVSAYLKLSGQGGMGLLLESVEGGAQRGRYSIIGLEPDVVWRAYGTRAEICRDPKRKSAKFKPEQAPTLDALRALLAESRIDVPAGLPPMAAGVFGYMGYDTVRLTEHLPNVPPDDLEVPDAVLMRPTVMVIFDGIRDEMTIVTPVRPNPGSRQTAEAAYKAALKRLRNVVASLEGPLSHRGATTKTALPSPDPVSNTTEAEYLAMVQKAKDYIVAGDIFQVVLSQRFSARFELPAFSLYRALRRVNPSPFLFHLDFGGFALVGSSPEILVRVRDGEVTIRPIAGTRRRDDDEAIDRALEHDLLADPKERAEHLMLLDLGRNDVGRVAEVGSVAVTSQFIIERYSHVMHIVSNVIGRLDEKKHDAVDALMAGFPAGTVSGAPKVRAMEVIDELEKSKRGPYAGCVGYFSADGNMDTCIVLRTALVKDGMVHVQAGAGIVHDSVPESEHQECINKAKAVVSAAEAAIRFAGGKTKSSGAPGGNNGNGFN
ncbi:MAG: anthranilate synthase component I [Alphaproteobacteria bacterium]|nr:anthranilate synthase component I [Alphaproteobacteria bacterium]